MAPALGIGLKFNKPDVEKKIEKIETMEKIEENASKVTN